MLAQTATVTGPNRHLNAAVQAKKHKYSVNFSHLNRIEAETAFLIASGAVEIGAYGPTAKERGKKIRRDCRWWCKKHYCKQNCGDLMQDLKLREISDQY